MTRPVRTAHAQSSLLRKGRRTLGALAVSLAALMALGLPSMADSATEYRLGPQDKLRVRVHEWRASRDEVFEWTALKEDYTVGASGTLSLPLVGDIPVAGMTTTDLSRLIGDRLKERLGMVEPPDTAVEIVQYRPFYIIGQVDKPGEYPFRPGLTVLQALSVAGGMQRISDMGLFRLERDSITARGDLTLIAADTNSLLARRARLQAELSHAEAIAYPKELTDQAGNASAAVLMDQERLIFETRRTGFTTQVEALQQLKTYLAGEVDSLKSQIEKEDTQIRLVQKELDGVSQLVEKGLSGVPRQLLLQRTIAQIEGERLRLNTSAVKAQQEISKTDIAILDLRNKWTNDVTLQIRETQAKLEELGKRANTSNHLLYEAQVTAPQFIAERARSEKQKPILKIVRLIDGVPAETVVTEAAMVAPGDTVKVELPFAELPALSELGPGGVAPKFDAAATALPAPATTASVPRNEPAPLAKAAAPPPPAATAAAAAEPELAAKPARPRSTKQ